MDALIAAGLQAAQGVRGVEVKAVGYAVTPTDEKRTTWTRHLFPRTLCLGHVPSRDLRALQVGRESDDALSHLSLPGGAINEVVPLAQTLKAIYLKYGVGYRLSRFQTGPNEGDWLAIVTYADATAYEKALALFSQNEELQQVFIKIAKFAKRISREMVIDLDL